MRVLTFYVLGFGVPTVPRSVISASHATHSGSSRFPEGKKKLPPRLKLYFFRRWDSMENIAANWAGSAMKTVIGKLKNQARVCTHTGSHARIQTGTNGWESKHGNCDSTGSLPSSHQSGHLISVTQHRVLLHTRLSYTPFLQAAPKMASTVNFCSLGNDQKLWLGEKKITFLAPLCSLFPLVQFLLFGALFKITTHTNRALKVIYNMPG